MAVAQFKQGDLPGTLGGTYDVYGDNTAQTLTILDNSVIDLRVGFNAGARDTITVTGLAQNFVISQTLGNVTLTSVTDGITLRFPLGTNGMNITFDNGDTRVLNLSGSNVVTLGAQNVGGTPTAVTPGPGAYTVTGNPQQLEGTAYIFTVTRTDTTVANEQLTFNVQGSTKGGTVTAADPGSDFTAAGNTVTFTGNSATATFTVNLNLDSDVEGLEGILAQVFKNGNVVGQTIGLIEDANKVGQTFFLTDQPFDTVGTGAQTDVVGSEGSTSVIGQDTIIVTENTIQVGETINGGAENDTLRILDAGTGFAAPNLNGMFLTITNIENAQYISTRGLFGGALNTTSWTGLKTFTGVLDTGVDQTLTFTTSMTSISLTNTDDGDINVVGGSGVLTINALDPGDVGVGQTAVANAFTNVFVNGGDDINITDRSGGQTLTNVQLSGFDDDVVLIGTNIATVGITNLAGVDPVVNITAANTTVNLSNIDVVDFDLTISGNLTVNAVGNTIAGDQAARFANIALGDFTSTGGNIVMNSNSGYFWLGDVNVNTGSTVTLNNVGGGFVIDDVQGPNLTTVTIAGASADGTFIDVIDGTNTVSALLSINVQGATRADINSIVEPGGNPNPGVVITATNSGGVIVNTQVGNNTQFLGSGDTGADSLIFGATTRTQTFGGGNDNVTINVGTGITGTFNGGADYDKLFMESNNAAKYSAAATGNSNFEELNITSQTIGTQDTINLATLGLTGTTTNVVSNIGPAAAVGEVVTFTLSGTASGKPTGSVAVKDVADKVTVDNVTVIFDDGATASTAPGDPDGGGPLLAGENLVTDFITAYNLAAVASSAAANDGRHYQASAGGAGQVVLTALAQFTGANLPPLNFVFENVQNIGAPAISPGDPVTTPGVTPVAAAQELFTITLNNVSVANNETITVTDGTNTFTWTNTSGSVLLGANGTPGNPAQNNQVADAFVAAFNNIANILFFPASAISYTASNVNGNIRLTSDQANNHPANLSLNQAQTTGLQPQADNYSTSVTEGVNNVVGSAESFTITIVQSGNGNDQFTFDGKTITLTGTENTNEAVAAALNGWSSTNWTATAPVNSNVVTFTNKSLGDVTNVTAANLVFTDDKNDSVPVATINSVTEGSVSGIILNQFQNNSILTLNGLNGTHTVNLAATTVNDTLNLVLNAEGNHGSVFAPSFENVIIDTDSDVAVATDILSLNDTALASFTVTGTDNLVIDTNSTAVRNVVAGNFGGALTWQADAGTSPTTAAPLTVTTGGGGSNINFGAVTVGGLAPIVFNGGGGSDFVQLGGIGTARVNISLNGGADFVRVGLADGGNDYSSILGFSASGASIDRLDFDGSVTVDYNTGVRTVPLPAVDTDDNFFLPARDQQLEPTAIFQDYLDQAAFGNATGQIHWFQFTSLQNGVNVTDTFVVKDNSALAEFEDGVDQIIRLAAFTGTLTTANFA